MMPLKQHKGNKLFIYFLGESFYWKSCNVCFHEAKELVEHFTFDSHYVAMEIDYKNYLTYSLSIFF